MIATDKGYPPLSDRARVVINVQRNLNGPVFTQAALNISIPENRPVDSEVQQVIATDSDNVSLKEISFEENKCFASKQVRDFQKLWWAD